MKHLAVCKDCELSGDDITHIMDIGDPALRERLTGEDGEILWVSGKALFQCEQCKRVFVHYSRIYADGDDVTREKKHKKKHNSRVR